MADCLYIISEYFFGVLGSFIQNHPEFKLEIVISGTKKYVYNSSEIENYSCLC